jgi:AcrR family transcriptional regulator
MAQSATRRQVNRLPPERRIADIMLAAKEVFTEKGYNDALISDISERAGVVEGSIYRFFTNKRDLLVRVVENWYDGLLFDEGRQFGAVRGTWNRLRFIVHHHLTTIKREPALSRLVFQELRPDPEYRKTRLFQLNQAYTHRIIDVVNEAVAAGEFRGEVSPYLVRDLIYGCIEHRTWSFLRNEGDFDVDRTADEITDIVYRGLAVSGPEHDLPPTVLSRLDRVVTRLESLADAEKAHSG